MREELYINGERVDVISGGITFTMKSNLFGEVGKITAGNSQTVKLPRTVKNMRILDLPEVVGRTGKNIRKRLPAMLLRSGIPIIRDGEAVIVNVTEDSYEVGLTFGVVSFLSAVKDGGSLNDMEDNGEYLPWDKDSLSLYPATYIDSLGEQAYRDYGFASYQCGVEDTAIANVHPMVSVEWLMKRIEQTYNFSMQFGRLTEIEGELKDLTREEFKNMFIMLAGKKNSKAAIDGLIGEYKADSCYAVNDGGQAFRIALDAVSPNYGTRMWANYVRFEQSVNYWEASAVVNMEKTFSDATLYLCLNLGTNQSPVYNQSKIISSAKQDAYMSFNLSVVSYIDLQPGDRLSLVLVGSGLSGAKLLAGYQLKCRYRWDDGVEPDDITYPASSYPIIPNLPSMKITDFIRMVGLLVGKFPIVQPDEPQVLLFVGVDDLRNNKSKAVDWSKKWNGEPKDISYTYLEAQKNTLDYNNDEDVFVSTRGSIVVNDDTLEKEDELAEIPLSGSNDIIPQYSIVDGELEEGDVSDRLLVVDDENVASFAGLSMANRVANWYVGYQDVMIEPVVIKGAFRLTEIDIMNLDYTRPVYLEQMGRYYGIVQVQYKGDTSEVELIQL